MQSALPPSLQKNIVGRGRPLSYVYTCANFVHVKNVSNLSLGLYKNINISQIKKSDEHHNGEDVSSFVPSVSLANRLFLHDSETLRDIYLSTWLFNLDVPPYYILSPQVIRLTHAGILCTSLLHRIKSSLRCVDQTNHLSRNDHRLDARKSNAYRFGNNSSGIKRKRSAHFVATATAEEYLLLL